MAMGMKRLRFRGEDVQELSFGLAKSLAPDPNESPEQRAQRYLTQLFGAPEVPTMSLSDSTPSATPDLAHEETLAQPLTDTTQVSYTQRYQQLPVHGTRVGVEMTQDGELVGIDGQVADVHDVDPYPKLSPTQARERLEALAGYKPGELGELQPSGPVVRWDEVGSRWALAYVFEAVLFPDTSGTHTHEDRDSLLAHRYRVFLDAHSGEEIVRVPLFRHAHEGTGADLSGRTHRFHIRKDEAQGVFVLEDSERKIRTCSLAYQSIWTKPTPLPGAPVTSPSAEFTHPAAVAAHAHAAIVYDYFSEVLKRRGVDGASMWINSAVECVEQLGANRVWRNAMWIRYPQHPSIPQVLQDGMMLYGQVRRADGNYLSVAEGLDVVAHELTHGVTDYTAALEYVTQSGALNESYSDIFGALIANQGTPLAQWKWAFGDVLNGGTRAIRDLKEPSSFGQPDHMDRFLPLQQGEKPNGSNDHGHVHGNSGIHNKAAYNLLTCGVFTADEASRLFYLTLTTPGRLSKTATFTDSRDGLVASCETLFRKLPEAELQRRTEAIREAFRGVGL